MLKITHIQVEHMGEGCVTDRRPIISFSLESDRPGESLAHAEVTDGSWKTAVTDQLNITYGGELVPFAKRTLHIHATGTSGETATGSAEFTFGRLDVPWSAQWITDSSYSFPKKQSPHPMVFRKRFAAGSGIHCAWINATALGVYELCLNGEKVGRDYFAPGFTSYAHQIQYQTYDITPLLARDNELRATVAGGWAAGAFTYNRASHISCDRQAFLCEMHIEYADGTTELVCSDPSWQVTTDSPYQLAEWYDGETYDATFEEGTAQWRQADTTCPRGKPVLLAQYGPPVRAFQTMTPVQHTVLPDGEVIYDFGQNFAGVISAEIRGAQAGQTLVFRHTEILLDGKLFVKPLRSAKARAIYTCRDGDQSYSPRFTYMGFRYVGVRGIQPEQLKLTALVLHSDFAAVGEFQCSNAMLNRLHENILWSGLSNFLEIPTDCPQRDERMGWTGDAAVFASTACYLFDMSRFFDKWLLDVKSEQGRGGGIPMVVPKQGDIWPAFTTACWGDSCVLVPWAEYLARGDRQLLARQYPVMRKFLKSAKRWAGLLSLGKNNRYIWKYPFQFGDWCAPEGGRNEWMSRGKEIATAYFANSCAIAEQVACILGKEEDARRYAALRQKVIRAYRAVFTDGNGNLKDEFQSGYVLPLHFGMAQSGERENMATNLERMIKENGNHLATGFPGTPYILFALSDNGHLEAAYNLLLQKDCPGWLYEVATGGTTIWERWDAIRPDGTVNLGGVTTDDPDVDNVGGMVSFNHYANGAVGDWMYRRIAGIEPVEGGYRMFRIAPLPGGGITEAMGRIHTPFGTVSSQWSIREDSFSITVAVPVSTECELRLPDGQIHQLANGTHSYSCSVK